MEEDKKLEKRKNIEIVVLSIIIVVLLGALIYLLFIKKDKPTEPPKSQDNQQVENNTNNIDKESTIVEKASYKTKDGKFTLKIIDKSSNKYIEEKYKDILEGFGDCKGYAFINDELLALTIIKEDELYASYNAYYPNNVAQSAESFIANKQDGTLIEMRTFSDEFNAFERFLMENAWSSYIKTNAGYFLIYSPITDPDILYTMSGKKLGYINSEEPKSDAQGVYVYDNIDSNFDFSNAIPSKYDVNGNKIG